MGVVGSRFVCFGLPARFDVNDRVNGCGEVVVESVFDFVGDVVRRSRSN